MSSLVEMGVLEPLAAAPGVSLTAKRTLARLNELARDTVLEHLCKSKVLVVHDEDCTANNAAFVTKWLDAVPRGVLRVHGVDGEMALGQVRQIAKVAHNTTWGGEDRPLGPLYENATACYFLGFALATTWSRFFVRRGQEPWCTVNESMTVMGDRNGELDLRRMLHEKRTARETALNAGAYFHNALLRTEAFAVADGDATPRLKHELRKRLPGGLGTDAPKRYTLLKMFVATGVGAGRVILDGLHLTDSDMGTIAPRVRAHRGSATRLKLNANAFGMIGIAALFAEPRPVVIRPAWPVLTHLLLRYTPIGPDGYPQLCDAITAKNMPQLQVLDLSGTGMGDIGARLVFNAVRELKELEVLQLDENPFGANGLTPLECKVSSRNRVVVSNLVTLRMLGMSEAMDRAAWQVLGRALMSGCFPKIQNLYASHAERDYCYVNSPIPPWEPAKLAVAAVKSRRKSDKAVELAVAALSTPGAKKRASKRAKKA